MKTTGYDRDRDIADTFSFAHVRMNDHDRALARTYMDEGAFVADVMLCAVGAVRTVIGQTSKLLSEFRLHPRA